MKNSAASLNFRTKLTTVEAEAIEEAESRAGKTPSERGREVLLHSDVVGNNTEMEMHISTEPVGMRMLLMGTLEPLLCGEKTVQDQLSILFRQMQSTKAAKAQELLEKRAKQRAEEVSRVGR